jgi:hypothetical protein
MRRRAALEGDAQMTDAVTFMGNPCFQRWIAKTQTDTMNDVILRDYLAAEGYSYLTTIGGKLCGLHQFAFTWGLVVGLDKDGYERRYCYESRANAWAALQMWNGDGHPSGPWIKCKGRGIDLLNFEFCEAA